MTYLQFHLVFIIPLVILEFFVLRKYWVNRKKVLPLGLLFLCTIAFIYTTPWDNYLVAMEVWSYSPERVIGTIGFVPIEEYMFFILQTVMTGQFLFWWLNRKRAWSEIARCEDRGGGLYWLIGAFFLTLSGFGFYWLFSDSTFYLGLICAWAMPVVALQWFVGGRALIESFRYWAWPLFLPSLYLWCADRFAIYDEIWLISTQFTTGLHIFGLPIEEALFFLTTNVLVVFGLVLFWKFQMGRGGLEDFHALEQL